MRTKALALLVLLVLLLTSCEPSPTSPQATIVAPIDCRVKIDGDMPLSLTGFIPEKAILKWEATAGTIAPDNTVSVIYKAPSVPGNVMITVKISSQGDYTVSYPCLVEADTTEDGGQQPPMIISTEMPEATQVSTITATETPKETENASLTVVISEIMGDPCGGDTEESANEYVELYNYGDQPIDVSEWFISVTREAEKGKRIVSWQTRYPKHELGRGLILDSGIIQPGSFAVVLSPMYSINRSDHPMPYTFPQGTVILTVETGKRIGDDVNGILGSAIPADGVFVYLGSSSKVDKLITTYGVVSVGIEPGMYKRRPGLPLIPEDCNSVQRKIPSGEDIPENWEIIEFGNPGEGPY